MQYLRGQIDPTGWHVYCSAQCIKYHIPSVLYRGEGQEQQVSSSLGMCEQKQRCGRVFSGEGQM